MAAIDDHPVMLAGLRSLASENPGTLEFVGHATTVAGWLPQRTRADVVLLDLQLRDGSRPRDNVQALMSRGSRVLVYTEGDRRAWVADAIKAGALGVIVKSQEPSALLRAIVSIHQGMPVISAEVAAILHEEAALRPHLSRRETETLIMVAQGMADKQVARVLGISEETVKEYLKRVRAKYAELGRPVGSRVEFHHRAIEDSLIDPPNHAPS